jgi:hypothetical protein
MHASMSERTGKGAATTVSIVLPRGLPELNHADSPPAAFAEAA